jgi:hypothetical protein
LPKPVLSRVDGAAGAAWLRPFTRRNDGPY